MATFKPSNKVQHASGRSKTVCTSAVLKHFGISHTEFHYSSSIEDMSRILRKNGWSVRSRKSSLGKNAPTVGELRKRIASHTSDPDGVKFMVIVERHVLLLDGEGKTVVDTDPRKRDRRKVHHVLAVFAGERQLAAQQAETKWLRETGRIPSWMTGREKVCDLTEAEVQRIIEWKKGR